MTKTTRRPQLRASRDLLRDSLHTGNCRHWRRLTERNWKGVLESLDTVTRHAARQVRIATSGEPRNNPVGTSTHTRHSQGTRSGNHSGVLQDSNSKHQMYLSVSRVHISTPAAALSSGAGGVGSYYRSSACQLCNYSRVDQLFRLGMFSSGMS